MKSEISSQLNLKSEPPEIIDAAWDEVPKYLFKKYQTEQEADKAKIKYKKKANMLTLYDQISKQEKAKKQRL